MRQAGDGRRVEQGDHVDLLAEPLLEPIDQHRPLDGAAAQLEEVIEDAHLVQPQHLAPQPRQELLQRRARGHVGPVGAGLSPGSAGRARRSTLPPGVRGKGRQRDEPGRHHVIGQMVLQVVAQRLGGGGSIVPVGDDISDQPRSRRRSANAATAASRTAGVAHQGRLDLAQLDAVAAHLHLLVEPSQELEAAVGHPAAAVARPVEPGPGRGGERVGKEALGRQDRVVQVAAGQPRPADVQLARHARSDRPELRVQNIGADVGDRPADRHGRPRVVAAGRSTR